MPSPSPPPVSEYQKKLEQETASTLFQLVWSGVKLVGSKLWTEAAIRSATHEYATHYRQRFGDVKVLGMAQPVPLHEIYTAVCLLSTQHLRAFTDELSMEREFKKAGRNHWFASSEEKRDGIEVANRTRFLNILGAPGSGKSTFLRRLGQEAMLARSDKQAGEGLSTNYVHAKLPVLIELRRFRQDEVNILSAITQEFVTCGFPEAPVFVKAALERGKLLVLLDGLDEVPNYKLDEVIRAVKDFIDRYGSDNADGDGNRFVMSCRTAHYKNFVPKFSDVVLADFSNEQIEKFAENWFSSLSERQERTAQALMKRLKDPQHQQALELARTPLLLTFLCMTYQDRQDLPPTQATLYRTALEILLHKWAAERRVHNEPVYAELTAELEVDMLAEMAATLFGEDRFFFTRQHVTDHIKRFMQNELNAPKTLDADQILTAIEVQQGLIVRRAQDAYSFSHLTIQEYLTAKELWSAGPTVWKSVVRDHLFEERWAVVFVLMAGMGKADELLLAMAESCQQRWQELVSASERLASVDAWCRDGLLQVDGDQCSSSRLAATRFALLALARELAIARDLDLYLTLERERDVNLALSRARGRARDLDLARARELARELAFDSSFDSNTDLAFDRDADRPRAGARARARAILSAIAEFSCLNPAALDSIRSGLAFDEENDPAMYFQNLWAIFHFAPADDGGLRGCQVLLMAWQLVVRCRDAAYRTTATGWDSVCDLMLTSPTNSRATDA